MEYVVRSRSARTTELCASEVRPGVYSKEMQPRAALSDTRWLRRLAFFVAPTAAMSYLLPHLRSGWAVDQAILTEEERVVVIRFGRDADATCMRMDEVRDPSFPPLALARHPPTCDPASDAPLLSPPRAHPPRPVPHAQTLASVADKVKNFAVIYCVDLDEVPDFNTMYELYDPCTVMFFYRNKHIMIDLGTGNNNKINWAMDDKQEFVDIVEVVYSGASKGRGLVVSPKDYSTKYRY
jgi:DIM1 family U5 snRNP protein